MNLNSREHLRITLGSQEQIPLRISGLANNLTGSGKAVRSGYITGIRLAIVIKKILIRYLKYGLSITKRYCMNLVTL
jgi:hypothetical protein